MKWKDVKENHSPQLKMSPIAVIPHKSRTFRIMQNLSNEIILNKVCTPSVNQNTVRIAPEKSLQHIGHVRPRMTHAIETAPRSLPVLFAKAYTQYGFWRVFVKEEGRWNFACVLPITPEYANIHIVVPNSI